MATIEREQTQRPAQPVFAASDGRRARRLRITGRVAAALVSVWLLALLAGAFGFGPLPKLPGASVLDRSHRGGRASRPQVPAGNPASKATSKSGLTGAVPSASSRLSSSRQRPTPASRRSVPVRRRAPVAPAPAPAPVVQVPPPPVSRGKPKGRAVRRQGNRTLVPPPPPGNGNGQGNGTGNGNGNGNSGTAPGQLRHQTPPPPPPPSTQ